MYLGRMLRRLEVVERGGERVRAQALAVERNAHRLDAQPGEPRERALVGFLLDQHGVAGRQQDAVDEIDGLQRAGGDQDLVRRAGDAGIAGELGHQEFAQRPVSERSAGEPIGGERRALAPQHRRGGRDETLERQLRGVVVAADEAEARQSGPFGGRRRQSGTQQRREIERSEGHECGLPRGAGPMDIRRPPTARRRARVEVAGADVQRRRREPLSAPRSVPSLRLQQNYISINILDRFVVLL